jgi:hypothetical protein
VKALLFAALTACLPLTPAPARAERWQLPSQAPLAEAVGLRGKLIREVVYARLPNPLDPHQAPTEIVTWKLDTGDRVVRLDFGGNAALLKKAERLDCKTVRVVGDLCPPFSPGNVGVCSLDADE